jgi:heparinase II/III-like protein
MLVAGVSRCAEQVGRQLGAVVYPDGAEAELTAMYHRGVVENLDNYVDTFRQSHFTVADSLVVDVMRMWSYLAFTLRPDGTTPENNDSDRRDIREKLKAAATRHNRPDWTYAATNGADGVAPRIGPSVTFPWAGHAVMRSGWDAAAQWSFFDAGPFGLAHQHYDKLHLSIDAFGRALLVDAGRFDYAPSAFRDYFVAAASHNVLLIDGAGQNKTPERAESPIPGGDYGSMLEFDYARGVFDAGYDKVLGRAVHTRTVVYLHGQYWVVADRVETDRARRVDALWHFAPECNVVLEKRSAVSTDEGQGNLRIVPVGGIPWRVALQKGDENPIQGWYSPTYTQRVPNSTAVYSADIPGTTTFAWVLLPARGAVPTVDARVVSSREDRIEVRVEVNGEAHVFMIPMNSWRPSVRRGG